MSMDLDFLSQQCAPTVAIETITALVSHESRTNPFAIGINGGARISRQPVSQEEAVETAEKLLKLGLSIDLGLAQINSTNLGRLGLTVKDIFEPCTNLHAAETVLRGCYDIATRRHGGGQAALQAALSCYNTGNYTSGFSNGYVSSIYKLAKVRK